MTRFDLHDAAAAADHAEAVWTLYAAVFGDAESSEAWRADLFDRHRGREDYRLATAYDGGSLLGFGWCFVGERGQFWPDLVVRTLPREVTDAWVGGHLEVVELAVDPVARGRGVGGRLLDLMTASRGSRRGLLGTSADEEDPAVRLYRRHGWQTLGLLYPDVQVMGLAGSATEGPPGLRH